MSLASSEFEALTFDCYGTLVDWETGIATSMHTLASLEGCDVEGLALDRDRHEAELIRGPFLLYGEVLAESLRRAALDQDLELDPRDGRAFADGMADWPVFPDSPAALERLGARFRLAILSNVETSTLARSVERLGTRFEACITAEEVRSYKPALKHFEVALERLDLAPDKVLHVACSPFHDLAPAGELGWRSAWINRRGDPPRDDVSPDLEAPDLATLVNELGV